MHLPAVLSRVTALLAAGGLALTAPLARGDDVTAPAVPPDLRVNPGATPFLEGHAVGTQNYVCEPSATGFAWSLFTPEATLFTDEDSQLITHFFSPNPEERGTVRAAWQHSRDSSTVWARLSDPAHSSTDPNFVAKGAVPWLLLDASGVRPGPTGGSKLTRTTFVQRVNTAGGVAPATGCDAPSDVGARAFVPYTADYYFFTGGLP
ncbi:MAG TPA: DUF3455 domain-containing protein [Solirubrobacter sp.]